MSEKSEDLKSMSSTVASLKHNVDVIEMFHNWIMNDLMELVDMETKNEASIALVRTQVDNLKTTLDRLTNAGPPQ